MSSELPSRSYTDVGGFDPIHGTFHLTRDWTDSSLTYSILEAVAAITGEIPEKLDPISDVVDPDALDALFESADPDEGAAASLTFSYNDCFVTVYSDGRIVIVPPG